MKKGTIGSVIKSLVHDTTFAINKEPVTQKGTIDRTAFKKLGILTAETDIKVLIHEKPGIDIVLDTYVDGPELKVDHDDDSVYIEATGGRDRSFISINLPSECLQITVPSDIAKVWNIKTGTGDVSAERMRTDSFFAVLGTGDLRLSDIKAGRVTLQTSSGDMVVRDIEADELIFGNMTGDAELTKIKGNHITGTSNSGELTVKDVHGGEFAAKVSSGEIAVRDVRVKETNLSCTSGSIMADNIETEKASLKASSGDIIFSLVQDCSIQASSSSGDMTISFKDKDPNADVIVRTSSGDIHTNLPMHVYRQSENELEGAVGEGGNLIQLRTGSGDVRIT